MLNEPLPIRFPRILSRRRMLWPVTDLPTNRSPIAGKSERLGQPCVTRTCLLGKSVRAEPVQQQRCSGASTGLQVERGSEHVHRWERRNQRVGFHTGEAGSRVYRAPKEQGRLFATSAALPPSHRCLRPAQTGTQRLGISCPQPMKRVWSPKAAAKMFRRPRAFPVTSPNNFLPPRKWQPIYRSGSKMRPRGQAACSGKLNCRR